MAAKKGSKKKEKMVFAKDKNQAVMAIVVMAILVLNGFRMLVQFAIDQYRMNHPPAATSASGKMADQMAMEQQKNLQSLENPNAAPPPGPASSPSANQNAAMNQDVAQDANNIYSKTMGMQGNSPSHSAVQGSSTDSTVEIMPRISGSKMKGKMVLVSVGSSGRSNPFLPAAENYVPKSLPYLPAPPETLQPDSDAGKVITTTISGIMYDQYSPSAIINIEGNDYLVKRGDVVNRYKILSISRNQVIVQLGRNIYKAGVGELLSPTTMNFNTIANLNKKFGGNNVSVNVRKKGY
jgi:hypothetical protein